MEAIAISTLANATVSLISSLLVQELAKKAGGKIGEKIGQGAWEKAEAVYQSVKMKFNSKPETKKVIEALEKTPNDDDLQGATRFYLKDMMEEDKKFAKEIAMKIKEASDAGADVVFQTTIMGDVKKLVQMGNVYGNVNI